jgi:hypothetical protein
MPLRINLLDVTHYPPDGSSSTSEQTPNPEWAEIEAAIRRLDRDEWPFICIHVGKWIRGETPEDDLIVMGGRGEYAIIHNENGGETLYVDPARGDKKVQIWESDQGSVRAERHLCNDLQTVLAIVRHYAETGKRDPGVNWKTFS